ncbi:MAG: hypothetical protein K2O20_09760 [Duncaniella sp.]|nr:hypothetical protein [Duncaniella sp.]
MKKILTFIAAMLVSIGVSAQENQVKRIPGKGYDPNQQQYSQFERSVWFSAEVLGGVSCHLRGHNMGLAEVDFTVGYRFSQYLKVGVGIGPRYYIDQGPLRRSDIKWGMPLFATVRGNLIPGLYRTVVPYWGIEAGASVRDGAFFRPTLGLRIGEPRNAFTIGISYMGQDIATYNSRLEKTCKYTSFACLRLGYEF